MGGAVGKTATLPDLKDIITIKEQEVKRSSATYTHCYM